MAIGATLFYSIAFAVFFFVLVGMEFLCVRLFPNPVTITIIHSVLTITNCLVFLAYIARYFKVKLYQLFPYRVLGRIIAASVLALMIVWGTRFLFRSDLELVQLIVDFVLFCIVFFAASFIFQIDYLSIVKPLIAKNE